jgi:hypothetical protein
MGIPLLKGRTFTGADNRDQSPKAAIVNATAALDASRSSVIRRVKVVKRLGQQVGNWLTAEEGVPNGSL